MHLKLAADGTVTECRETLNAELAALSMPETQENKVVRMIAHYIVAEHLDPLHDEWQRDVNALRAGGRPLPPEPNASFKIDCVVEFGR